MTKIATEITLSDSPAQEALALRRREVARLAQTAAERELELSELRSELIRFERRYYRAIGSRYVELDHLRARIAELKAEQNPADDDSIRDAWHRRFRAERSESEFEAHRQAAEAAPEDVQEKGSTSEEVKRLYRKIAVQIHPDRAEDEAAEAYRTSLMAELNAAYDRGDTERMRSILDEWLTRPEAVTGFTPEAEFERLVRISSRLEKRIAALDAEIERISISEMARLMRQVAEATSRQRDLLKDLAAELDLEIERARREVEELENSPTPVV